MAKVLNSISLDAPASPITPAVNDTFAFSGTPGFTGTGGVQRYDFKWEVNKNGAGYVTIAASGTGLITSGTNPLVNTNSQTQNSITVQVESSGSYVIRMAGAPTSGGSYTVFSSTQSVTVAATHNLLADDIATGTPTLTNAALGQTHGLLADDVATPSPTLTQAALGQTHALLADDVATSSPTLTTATLQIVTPLFADDVATGAPTLTNAALGQTHVLLADSIVVGTPTLTAAALGQAHALLADDVATDTPILSTATVTASGGTPVVVVEVPRPPRPGDGGSKRRRIFKPTGLIDRPRTVQERVKQTAEIAREIEAERTEELQRPAPKAYYPPIELMSQADVDRELGERLREIAHEKEQDEEMLMLIAMVV